MLEEDHRVIIPDRLDHQALGFVRRRRYDAFQSGYMGENRVQALRVLSCGTKARAKHGANYHWSHRLASENITEFRRLIENLVKANSQEIDKHKFRHRSQAASCCSNGCTDKGRFGNWRIKDAVSKLPVQSF